MGPAGAAGANGGSAEAQLQHHQSHQHQQQQQQQLRSKATGSGVSTGNPLAAINGPAAAAAAARRASEAKSSFSSVDGHVPHMICECLFCSVCSRRSFNTSMTRVLPFFFLWPLPAPLPAICMTGVLETASDSVSSPHLPRLAPSPAFGDPPSPRRPRPGPKSPKAPFSGV